MLSPNHQEIAKDMGRKSRHSGLMLSTDDYKLLSSFARPRVVLDNERYEVERLVSEHLLAQGIIPSREEKRIYSTARLSDYGRRVLKIEMEARGDVNFFRRIFSKLPLT